MGQHLYQSVEWTKGYVGSGKASLERIDGSMKVTVTCNVASHKRLKEGNGISKGPVIVF